MLKPTEVKILKLIVEDRSRPASYQFLIKELDIHPSHVYKYVRELHHLDLIKKDLTGHHWEISRKGLLILRVFRSRL